MAHRVHQDHGGIERAAEGDHGAHGYGGVVCAEGLEDTQVAGTVGQLTENEATNLKTK